MRKLLLIAFLALLGSAYGQSKVYIGEFSSLTSLLYEIHPQQVIRISSVANKTPYLFRQGNRIYFDNRKSFTDVLYTIEDNHIYKGNSNSTFDLLYTLQDGRLYIGDGRFNQTCLFTFNNGKIYKGDSSSSFDVLMCYELDNPEDLIIIAAIIAPY